MMMMMGDPFIIVVRRRVVIAEDVPLERQVDAAHGRRGGVGDVHVDEEAGAAEPDRAQEAGGEGEAVGCIGTTTTGAAAAAATAPGGGGGLVGGREGLGWWCERALGVVGRQDLQVWTCGADAVVSVTMVGYRRGAAAIGGDCFAESRGRGEDEMYPCVLGVEGRWASVEGETEAKGEGGSRGG